MKHSLGFWMIAASALLGCGCGDDAPAADASIASDASPVSVDATAAVDAAPQLPCEDTLDGDGSESSPYRICSGILLDAAADVTNFATAHFVLDRDIVAEATQTTFETTFSGTFDGRGFAISGWGSEDARKSGGLFTSVTGEVRNLRFTGHVDFDSVIGGGLIANFLSGTIDDVSVQGSIINGSHVGLLVGRTNPPGVIHNSFAAGSVANGGGHVGGLVGNHQGTIERCHSEATVAGAVRVGGLVGSMMGTVTESEAVGSVAGNDDVGCLVGTMQGGSTTDSKGACLSVTSVGIAGGLVGDVESAAAITRTLSTTAAITGESPGGLVGNAVEELTTTSSYYAEAVVATSAAGTASSSDELEAMTTFAGWDFVQIWGIEAGNAPHLRWTESP